MKPRKARAVEHHECGEEHKRRSSEAAESVHPARGTAPDVGVLVTGQRGFRNQEQWWPMGVGGSSVDGKQGGEEGFHCLSFYCLFRNIWMHYLFILLNCKNSNRKSFTILSQDMS